ncbi:M1 family metallopeptidase [Nonomuraea zeae]|uniref:Aminopeptidase N n=1 Tax=Nonomuraea zeae TaxID=1642303 RepID=A0A5S4G7J6_9ACTN|nr:M1 family metallopeptidase [Nonomuraea zeae]TMR28842.1 M1 family metallopeptidase [Nonomuraea zeae]
MFPRSIRRAAIAAALSLTLSVPLSAPASAADRGPGAPGIGDVYFPDYGNGGYDVKHYGLKLDYQPGTDRLEGQATLLATASQTLTRFNLDFLLDVQRVEVNGRPAAFARTGVHELEITPARALPRFLPFVVEVTYAGTPSSIEVPGIVRPWIKRADGALALGEPEIAWWWYPSNDHPADKATFDITVTVPEGKQAISNGVLASQRTSRGRTTFHWLMDKPMATYLAMLYIGDIEVHRARSSTGLPVTTAYDKTLGARLEFAKASVERTAEIVDWESSVFGRYPFSSMGGSVVNENVGFALETQSHPVYDSIFFESGPDVSVVVHENAHQWFGDSVALKQWRDIWLNEGFATYAEWLWSEKEGTGTAAELANAIYNDIPADHPRFWLRVPGDPTPPFLFYASVYWRGGMTLQALRGEVGDQDFFAIIKAWAKIKQHGNGNTDEFISLSEKISGEQLDALFQTWLFQPGKPANPPAAVTAQVKAQTGPPASYESHKRLHELLHGPA